MPLLGGAGKMGAGVASGDPRFTSDPYVVIDFRVFPTDALAGIEIDSDGGIEAFKSSGNQGDIGRWDNGLGTLDRADYDFRLDIISGSANWSGSDAVNTWIAGTSLIAWAAEELGFGEESFSATLRIRPTGGGADFDTASVTCTASSEL